MKLFQPIALPENVSPEITRLHDKLTTIFGLISTAEVRTSIEAIVALLKELTTATDKRSIEFKAIAATTIYYLAYVCHGNGASDRAEKQLVKAQSIFEVLASKFPERFDAPLLTTVEASTTVFRSRLKQLNTLAHYQVAISAYTASLSTGGKKALSNLINTLHKQGDLLLKMGNDREAVKYYSQAIKYLNKKDSTLGMEHLRISISLGKALLNLFNRQDTARQLLQSMIPLAVSLKADNELEDIEYTLAHAPQKDIIDKIKLLFK